MKIFKLKETRLKSERFDKKIQIKNLSKLELVQSYRSNNQFFAKHEFGGGLIKQSHPKSARPFSKKFKTHFVLKTQFKMNAKLTKAVLHRSARMFKIKVYGTKLESQIIQIIILAKTRENLSHFLRTLTGVLARKTLNSQKGSPSKFENQFWFQRPFSRILIVKTQIKRAFSKSAELLALEIYKLNTPNLNTS